MLAVSCAPALRGDARSRMDRRPNIVLVMSDQHNPHVVGCEGDAVVRTPHIDALAERGVHVMHSEV